MKLVTFVEGSDAASRLGVLTDQGEVYDVVAAEQHWACGADPAFKSMQALIEGGRPALDRLQAIVNQAVVEAFRPLQGEDAVRLLAPLPLPIQMRDCLCFEEHLLGSAEAVMRRTGANEPTPRHVMMLETFRERPIYYKANRFAVCGPDTDVVWPPYSQVMDYELEMGCVIGATGRDISLERAPDHIFGYTIFNDFSARDTQGGEMNGYLGPSKSKDFDNANVLGPCIVTADSFDPYSARMIARVNGEVRSEGNSSSRKYTFPDLITFISQSETLHAGEVLGSGTVGGGCGLEQGRLLEHGDVVELEIEGIGVLRNRVLRSGHS